MAGMLMHFFFPLCDCNIITPTVYYLYAVIFRKIYGKILIKEADR